MSNSYRDEKKRNNTLPIYAYVPKKGERIYANRRLRRKIKKGLEVQNKEYKKVEEVKWNVL